MQQPTSPNQNLPNTNIDTSTNQDSQTTSQPTSPDQSQFRVPPPNETNPTSDKHTTNNNPNKTIILLLVLAFAAFFAFFRISDIPPGNQNDVLRAVLAPEQFLNNLDAGTTGLRQMTAYFLLGGYWTYYLIDILRESLNIHAMTIVSRLPSAIFFIATSYLWFRTLKLINLTNFAKIVFFLIFLPSAAYITYSHHIPLVGGYFFFCTAALFYFLKFLITPENKYRYLALALVSAGLSTYTHGISLFFLLLVIPIITLLIMIFRPDLITQKVNNFSKSTLKDSLKILATGIIFAITVLPLFDGILYSDKSLQVRQATTIKYLYDNNETDIIPTKIAQKIISYIHPNTLVTSGKITTENQFKEEEFKDIKDASKNQWVTTQISPFGVASAAAYLGVIYIFFRMFSKSQNKKDTTRKLKYLLTTALTATYVLLPIFPNYDNPSVAKVLPALMFIPLSIAIVAEEISAISPIVIPIIQILLLLANATYNVSYLYSEEYPKGEMSKYYEFNYADAIEYMSQKADFKNIRIYLDDNNPDVINNFTLYLSPFILNRMVLGKVDIEQIQKDEQNFIFTDDEDLINDLLEKDMNPTSHRYNYPNDETHFYLVELDTTSSTATKLYDTEIIPEQNVTCTTQYYYPQYTGEFEYILHQYRYYPDSYRQITIDRCTEYSSIQKKFINPKNLSYESGTGILTTGYPTNFWGETNQIEESLQISSLSDSDYEIFTREGSITYSFEDPKDLAEEFEINVKNNARSGVDNTTLKADYDKSDATIVLDSEKYGEGTYFLQFEYDIDNYGYLDFFIIDGIEPENRAKPFNIVKQNYDPAFDGSYSTLFYLPKGHTFTLVLNLYNHHFNIDLDKHPVEAKVKKIRLVKLTPSDIFSNSENYYTSSATTQSFELNSEEKSPGVLKIENMPDGEFIINTNQPLSSQHLALKKNLTPCKSENRLINGISNGIYINPEENLSDEFYLVNLGVIKAPIFFASFITIIAIISGFNYKKKKSTVPINEYENVTVIGNI